MNKTFSKNIVNFNENEIEIPNSYLNEKFKLKSLVYYYDVNKHFTCLVRVKDNKWLEISDNHARLYPAFKKNFQNVYYMILEKITT